MTPVSHRIERFLYFIPILLLFIFVFYILLLFFSSEKKLLAEETSFVPEVIY